MNNINRLREEFDEFLTSKNFDLTNHEVIKKALELEKTIKKTQVA